MKIYLINGESYLLINEQVGKIVKDSKNVTIFDISNNSVEDIIVEAGYFSMFEEEKYIIVKNASFFGNSKIKDSDIELLLNYLEKPNNNTTIIFICNIKLDMRKKITKIMKDKYQIINIPNLSNYEIINRVKTYFAKEGFTIDEESIKYIIKVSINNYDIIMQEVNKLILYYDKPGHIKQSDVENITSHFLNTNNFLFVDAIVDNDLEKSLALYQDLKIIKVEPAVLLSLLNRDFRIMLNIKIMLEQEKREYVIMNELGLLDWQLEKYLKKVFPYKIKELENIILKLAQLDLDIKRGKVDRFIGLELFILDICE